MTAKKKPRVKRRPHPMGGIAREADIELLQTRINCLKDSCTSTSARLAKLERPWWKRWRDGDGPDGVGGAE